MTGIPADLDLSSLVNAEVERVCLGAWQIEIQFNSGASITMNGGWDLSDDTGQIIDQSSDVVRERPFQLHRLLQRIVTKTEIDSPLSLTLHFTWGLVLRVYLSWHGFSYISADPLTIAV